jgi:thiamine pyrophosphate-dependent acetolactate synthase large subunit-like protein
MDGANNAQGMRTIPVYELVAGDLKAHGVEAAFGLMSDDTMGIVVGLDGFGIAVHGARQETAAVAMAEGYSAATGKLGVAVIGRGPALANGLNGIINASRSRSKILVISGAPPITGGAVNGLGPDLKAFNAADVLSAAGVQVFAPLSVAAARIALADAVAVAELGKAAVLLLPGNVQEAHIEVPERQAPFIKPNPPRKPQPARQASIDTAVGLLMKSRKPLIVAGMGAYRSGARDAIERLARKIGALCVTSLKAKDLFRGSPYDLGILGSSSHSAARRYAEQADCVLAFGASLNFLTMSGGRSVPAVPLIQCDALRSAIGLYGDADVGLVGDARLVAEQLETALPDRPAADKPHHAPEVLKTLAEFDQGQDFKPMHTPRTLDPRALAIELDKMLPKDRNVVWDAGNFFQAVQYVAVPSPAHFKATVDFGSIGLGLPTAVGFALGRPEIPTIAMLGDGGLLMALGELESTVREGVPLVVVVYNDAAYGAEVVILKMKNMPTAKAKFADVDLAPLAETLGYDAHTIRTIEDLHQIAPLLANPDGPIFLDCKTNGAVEGGVFAEFVNLDGDKT